MPILKVGDLFAAGQAFMGKKAWLLENRPSRQEVADLLTKEMKIKITKTNIKTLMKMTGIHWREKVLRNGGIKISSRTATVLAVTIDAITQLYGRMGEPMPPSFIALIDSMKKPGGDSQ